MAPSTGCAPTTCGRREAWIRFLPIPEHLAFSDWYFSVNMAREYDFYYSNQVLADYRVHAENMHVRTILDRTAEKSITYVAFTATPKAKTLPLFWPASTSCLPSGKVFSTVAAPKSIS